MDELNTGLLHVEAMDELGFFTFMDRVTDAMATGEISDATQEAKAEAITVLCDDAVVLAKDRRLCLWYENAMTFAAEMPYWKRGWMLMVGVEGSLNREGRRKKSPHKNIIALKLPAATQTKKSPKKRNGGGFG